MTDVKPPFTDLVRSLPVSIPFVGPETLERQRGAVFEARLGANESAFGMSAKAREAFFKAAQDLAWYGDPTSLDLREALAEIHRVHPDEILIGAGIDGILGNVVRMSAGPGNSVVTSAGAYPTFNYHVAGFGAQLHTVPYKEDHEDPEALLDAAKAHNATLIYMANPDNPMGSWYDRETIQRLIDRIPEGTLLILDEAYIEFAPHGTAPAIDTSDPRVMRMRTFSKAHGMAGLRIGYTIAYRDVIAGLQKVRNHFEVSRPAQAAALGSLQDPDFIASIVQEVARGRADYTETAVQLGLKALPGATNFVTIDMGGDGDKARKTLKLLQAAGVFVRMPGVAPLDRCIRVTVGAAPERHLFAERFKAVLNSGALDQSDTI